jgi:hypothetical protein
MKVYPREPDDGFVGWTGAVVARYCGGCRAVWTRGWGLQTAERAGSDGSLGFGSPLHGGGLGLLGRVHLPCASSFGVRDELDGSWGVARMTRMAVGRR